MKFLQSLSEQRRRLVDYAKSLVIKEPPCLENSAANLTALMAQQISELRTALKDERYNLARQTKATRQALQQLQKVRTRYSALYDTSPVGYFNLSAKGLIFNSNNKAVALLKRDKADVLGQPLSSFVHHASLENFYKLMKSLNHTNTHASSEIRFVRQQGMPFHALVEISCKFNRYGDISELLVLLQDISERKQYEQALMAEMDRLQVTLHSIGDGVITTDSDGVIDYMNPIAENLTGWSTENAIGKPLQTVLRVIDEHTRKSIANPVARCLRQKQVISLGKESLLIGKNSQKYAIQSTVAPLRNRLDDILGVVVVFSNVTEARNMAQQIAHQAIHDALTGLVNRREFEKRLTNALKSVKDSGTTHCLCYLDLDQFKIVNDTAGHVAGDELLRKLTLLFKSKIRARDTLARHGGDEFGLLLDNCPLDQAFKIANSLVAAARNFQFEWNHQTFSIGVSIGLVPITSDTHSAAELMSQADIACYTAKDLGRNRVHVYQSGGEQHTNLHMDIVRVAGLSDALKADRFKLYCQSIMPLQKKKGEPLHYELLLRSVNTDGKIELPTNFIPAAERYGMMAAVDRWVIRAAFVRYMELFDESENIQISLNLSGNSLMDPGLLNYVHMMIHESGMPPHLVCFEITETAAVSNLDQARKFILDLKQIGCRFALDDFGSGLSSFTYLKNLPVDYLKIDGSFVHDMANDPINVAMVAAINEVGHIMGIKTIAECAETDAVIEQLRKLGVDYAQGYATSRPMPLDVIANKLHHFSPISA